MKSKKYLTSIIKQCLDEILAEQDITNDPKVASANAIAASAKVKVADEKNKFYTTQIKAAADKERSTVDPKEKQNIRKAIKDLKDKQKTVKLDKSTANLEKTQAISAKSGKIK